MALIKELDASQFGTAIRTIKNTQREVAVQIRHMTHKRLKELGVPRDTSKAVAGIPKHGTNDVNPRGLYEWMDRIESEDEKAIEQLVAIDATAVARTS